MRLSPFVFVLILIAAACGQEDPCDRGFVDLLDLEPYNGQEIGCRTFYDLYLHEGTEYAVINNYCADLLVITATDCNGNVTEIGKIPGGEYLGTIGLE